VPAAPHPLPRPIEGGDLTGHIGRSDPQASVDEAIAKLAAAQHLVFGVHQLEALGLSADAASKRARTGRLHRIYMSVYSIVPESMLTPHGRYMAAVLACGPGAVLSHHSAASLLGLRRSSRTRIDVTVAGRSQRRHAGIRVHRSTTLTAADVEIVDGIPCTTIERTLLDIDDGLTQRQLERAFDQAEQMEVLDLRKIDDQVARNPTRRGVKRIKAILRDHRIGSTVTDSEIEERMLSLLRPTGCPMPETQVWIDPRDGGLMVQRDFVWRRLEVDVETDGGHHRTILQMETDTRNDQRLEDADWVVRRFTWKQLEEEPRRVVASVLRTLRRAGATW
jgi:predicted transcriptional regulator of viral defense system